MFKINVSAIINKGSEILIIQRSETEDMFPGFWGIPGGTMEVSDRSIEDCLRREIMEEVGIEIGNIHFLTSENSNGKVYIKFTALYVSGEIHALDGVASVKWLGLNELSDKKFTPNTKKWLVKTLKKL